jgi:hypothetical protein
MAQTSAYEEVWKKARESQAAYAQAEIAGQYKKLSDYNNAWITSMNQYIDAQNKLTQGQIELSNWEDSYRTWQHQQYQNANTIWFNNMSNALDRYVEALNTELVEKQAEIEGRRAQTNALIYLSKSSMADTLVKYHQYQSA